MLRLLVLSMASAVFACSEKDKKHCEKEHGESYETLHNVTWYYTKKEEAIAYCKDSRPALECLQDLADGCRNDEFVKEVHLYNLKCKDSVLREYDCFANATRWFIMQPEKGSASEKECDIFKRAVRNAKRVATADCSERVASEIKDFVVTWHDWRDYYHICDIDVEDMLSKIQNASNGTTSNHQKSSTKGTTSNHQESSTKGTNPNKEETSAKGTNSNHHNHQSIVTLSLFLLLLLV